MGELLNMVNPATAYRDYNDAMRRGRYGEAALNAFGLIPGEALAAGAVKLACRSSREQGGGTRASTTLPMDEASRMARSEEMGNKHTLWRGESDGSSPSRYPDGGFFSRDKSYSDAFAQRGGLPEAREFRLNLDKAYKDYEPLTAEQVSRLIRAADPKFASQLAEMFRVTPARFIEVAKANPTRRVTDPSNTAYLRQAMEYNSTNWAGLLRRAGFNAFDSGRDVRMLTGKGIRHKDAVFDPAKAKSTDIFASVTGAVAVPALALGSGSYPIPE
jgi:hypothetical protein